MYFLTIPSALMAARHTVVILTGDVHYGRVAVSQIEPGATSSRWSPRRSPWSPGTAQHSHEAPPDFPVAIPGMAATIRTAEAFRLDANHFTTMGSIDPVPSSGCRSCLAGRTNGRLPRPSHEPTYESARRPP